MQALKEAGGQVVDEDLSKFCTLLVERKTAPPDTLANIIRKYFNKKGTSFPFEIDLTPSETGHASATLKANKKLIKGFWDTCRGAMWENVNSGFMLTVDDLHARVATMNPDSITPNSELTVKIRQVREMMEAQSRIMHHKKVGVDIIPREFDNLMSRFRLVHNDFLAKAKGKAHGVEAQKVYGVLKKQLEAHKDTKNSMNLEMGVASIVAALESVHNALDFVDNTLLDGIKKGTFDTAWYQDLKTNHETSWSTKVNNFLGNDNYFSKYKLGKERQSSLDNLHKKFKDIEIKMNIKLLDNCVARGVRGINQSFNRSVDASTGGKYFMKGMMLINLKDELQVYSTLIYQGKWEDFGSEMFKRRVPGYSAVENAVLGKYFAASWDLVKTLIPAASLFDTAARTGTDLGKKYWKITWQEELEVFIDELYENADFVLIGVDRESEDIILSKWMLASVTYRGEEVDLSDYFDKKESQIREMYQYFKQDKEYRKENPFPIEYVYDGITAWLVDDILKENIGANDPFLMYYKSMTDKKKNKVAGKRLKEHFKELWYTRWEVLKLKFMEHLKEKLEERKSSEMARLSGQLPKMLEELMEIAKELQIEDEVEENIRETLGTEFVDFVYSLSDWLKGIKRDIMGEADVWDVYEKNAATLEKYLKIYRRILKNRDEAEKYLKGGPSVIDEGLRLLTGKYFLTGKASVDDIGAQPWARLPAEAEVLMEEKIREIKDRCAEVTALEKDELCFDQNILRKMVYHHVFRECWKHVYDHPEASGSSWSISAARVLIDLSAYNDDAADDTWDLVSGEDENTKSDQDIAREQHEYHSKKIKSLIIEVENTYCTEQKTGIEDLLEMTHKIEKLSQESIALCQTASTMIEAVKSKLDGIKKPLNKLEIKISKLKSAAARTKQTMSNIRSDHSQVENLTSRLGKIAVSLDETSNWVCEKVQELQNVDKNSQRDAICNEIFRHKSSVRDNYTLAKNYYRQIKEKIKRTKEELAKLEEAKKTLDGITTLSGMIKTIKDCKGQMDTIADKIAAARQKIEEIPPLRKEAKKLAKYLRKLVKPMLKLESGKEMWEKIEDCLRRIDKAYEECKRCPARPDTDKKKIVPTLKNLDSRLENLNKAIQRLHEIFGQPGEEGSVIKEAKEKLDLIEYLDQMAVRYVERIAMASADADYCFSLADGLRDKPVSYVLPDFSGQPVSQATGMLGRVNISVETNERQDANHPDKEYTVISQWPQAGLEVKIKETTVKLDYFGELNVDFYLLATDCDHIKGSHAAYDPQTRRADCVCSEGLIYNANKTVCINCKQYRRRIQAASDADNIQGVQSLLANANTCSWAAEVQLIIDEMIEERQCGDLATRILGSCRASNVRFADPLIQEARALGCHIPNSTMTLCAKAAKETLRRQEEEFRRQEKARKALWDEINKPDGYDPGGGYFPPTGGGNTPLPGGGVGIKLTSRTIVADWDITGSCPSGTTVSGHLQFLSNGTYSYDFHHRHADGTSNRNLGAGTWTLSSGNFFRMKFDKGAIYEGTVRGDASAFTLIATNNENWTLNFRRR
ncbi:MAG: PASTA domain-containing protein [Candidatus Omnitrophica bacterium]|nr:PASTA domain-containing protein [Candidatus Omnitrophota bacterium]